MVRIRKKTSVTLDPELLAKLDKWRLSREFDVSRAQALDAAIKLFLEEKEKGGADG